MAFIYEWKGKNPKGRKIKGEMEAETPEQVRTSLERRKIEPRHGSEKSQKTCLRISPFSLR